MATTLAAGLACAIANGAAGLAVNAESHSDLASARAYGLRAAAALAGGGDYAGAAFVAWAANGATAARRLELNELAAARLNVRFGRAVA